MVVKGPLWEPSMALFLPRDAAMFVAIVAPRNAPHPLNAACVPNGTQSTKIHVRCAVVAGCENMKILPRIQVLDERSKCGPRGQNAALIAPSHDDFVAGWGTSETGPGHPDDQQSGLGASFPLPENS
jgi:hypothetical protein